jgi:hypothetical protein
LNEFLGTLSGRMIDFLIYGAVAVCFILGLTKCVFPLRRAAHLFRKGIHSLAVFKPADVSRPDWQDSLFLGKPLQKQWKRFLMNAEQLDARGLSCNIADYINDDTILIVPAHFQLAEVIPGLLTSLGILGTFIGLMRGLGGLDLSSADKTVVSIHTMISGMTFAYGTSIAGLTCSLLFNIFFRTAQGSATGAMDDFTSTFEEVVMQYPLDDQVRQTCYMEDQATFFSSAFGEVNQKLETGIGAAIDRSFAPVGQSMQNYILTQTQSQVEGLNHVVNQFVEQMNNALGGQFMKLGQTLAQVNQSQAVSIESVTQTMNAVDTIMDSIQRTGLVAQTVIDRFDSYVGALSHAQESGARLMEETAKTLSGMHRDAAKQTERFKAMQDAQADLSKQMEQYAAWSGRVLEAVEKQSDAASDRAHEIANEMNRSGKLLTDSYASFAENISSGLARTMGLFEENMHDMTAQMVKDIKTTMEKPEGVPLDLKQFSRVQQALNDMTQALTRATKAAQQMAEGA